MTADTTMTDVDTSMEALEKVVADTTLLTEHHARLALRALLAHGVVFVDASGFKALSSRCDELERLAGGATEALHRLIDELSAKWQERGKGKEFDRLYEVEIKALEAIEAYQRKGK